RDTAAYLIGAAAEVSGISERCSSYAVKADLGNESIPAAEARADTTWRTAVNGLVSARGRREIRRDSFARDIGITQRVHCDGVPEFRTTPSEKTRIKNCVTGRI